MDKWIPAWSYRRNSHVDTSDTHNVIAIDYYLALEEVPTENIYEVKK